MSADSYLIDNFSHLPHTIPAATESSAGVLSAADKAKLDSLNPGGEVAHYPTLASFPSAATVPGALAIAEDTDYLYFSWAAQWNVVNATDSSFVIPQNFGAVADGVTDDTAAFQAALNAANAAGKALLIPPGNYSCGMLLDTTTTRSAIYGADGCNILTSASTWIKFAPTAGKTGGTIVKNIKFSPTSGYQAMQPIVWLHGTTSGGLIFVELDSLTFISPSGNRAAPAYFDCIRMDAVFEGRVSNIWGLNLYGSRGIVYEANGFNSGNVHIDTTSLKNAAIDIVIDGAGDVVSNLLNTVLLSNIKTVRTTVSGGGQDNAPYQTVTLTAQANPGDTTITVSAADATNVQTQLSAGNPQWVVLSDVNSFGDVHPILAANTVTGVLTLGGVVRYVVSTGTIQGVGSFGIVLGHNARGIQLNSCHTEQSGVGLYVCGSRSVQMQNPIFGLNNKRGVVAINGAQDVKCYYAIYSQANTAQILFEVSSQGSNVRCELIEPAFFGAGTGPVAFMQDNSTPANSTNNYYEAVHGLLAPRVVTLNPLDSTAANRPKANGQGEVVQYSVDNKWYVCTGFFSNPTWSQIIWGTGGLVSIDGANFLTLQFAGATGSTFVKNAQSAADTIGRAIFVEGGDAGTTTTVPLSGGGAIVQAGAGSPGTASIQAGLGADVKLTSGLPGANGGAGGNNSGNIVLDIVAATGAGTDGFVFIRSRGVNKIQLNPALAVVGPATANTGSLGTTGTPWGLASCQHYVGSGTAPTVAVGAAAQLGTGPAAAITAGSDAGQSVTLTTGTGPTAFVAGTADQLFQVNFNTAFGAAPKSVVIVPANKAAAQLMSGTNGIGFYIDQASSTTAHVIAFAVSNGTPTLAASTPYEFALVVMG